GTHDSLSRTLAPISALSMSDVQYGLANLLKPTIKHHVAARYCASRPADTQQNSIRAAPESKRKRSPIDDGVNGRHLKQPDL
ncbi:MAG: hypothetical protein ABW047_06270, partial [Nitrospiraceae bacterium]